MTTRFIITNSKKNPTPIYVRFKIDQKNDFKEKIGLEIDKKEWSKAKQLVKHNAKNSQYAEQVNSKLKLLENFIHNSYNRDYSEGVTINKNWIKSVIKKCFNQPDKDKENYKYYLTDFINFYIEKSKKRINKKTNKPLSIRTIRDFQTTLSYLLKFEQLVSGTKIKLTEIDMNFYHDLNSFLEETYLLSKNTVGGHIKNIKQFCRDAKRENLKVCLDFEKSEFYSPNQETNNIYLKIDEINKIFNYELTNERLDNARDWFIIGLWTALRVSDLLNLNKDKHIIDNEFIEKTNYKTGIITVIPIHEQVRSVLNKRDGNFPRKISDQKFNDYIKEVCEIVGLKEKTKGSLMQKIEIEVPDLKEEKKIIFVQRLIKGIYPKYKLVSSHICRRTFATYHYGKLDTLTIMKLTGHKTESQFLEYIKTTPKEHAQKFKELWNQSN